MTVRLGKGARPRQSPRTTRTCRVRHDLQRSYRPAVSPAESSPGLQSASSSRANQPATERRRFARVGRELELGARAELPSQQAAARETSYKVKFKSGQQELLELQGQVTAKEGELKSATTALAAEARAKRIAEEQASAAAKKAKVRAALLYEGTGGGHAS